MNDYKPLSGIHRTLVLLVGSAALLAGCATSNPGPQRDESFNQSMSEAEAALTSGQRDQAVSLFEQIAKNNPTREEPWSRIAQIQFGAERYPQAIVAAEEALQRDSADRKAKSVLAVSGLRVARRSLQELRADSALAGDVRSDAQLLARMLRDTLGEQVLFPRDKGDAQPAKPVPRRRPTAKPTAAAQSTQSAAPSAPAAPSGGGSADPFGALR
ncbi:tetratricopeptide repeat protein [Cupriavidus necator]|uniref:tetratricopeptide repeat protein n=1 Tax=Cupriavidus necator TaxID=106590 RepID=UPI00339DA66B